jgi:hypothetical protein
LAALALDVLTEADAIALSHHPRNFGSDRCPTVDPEDIPKWMASAPARGRGRP